ncbi:MAG: nucleoside-triphosphatase [Candidatus Bipolaricaulia bacterium]
MVRKGASGRGGVIDEIGPMELLSDQFKQAVLDVLDSSRPLLGTVVSRPFPWVDELKQREEVELCHVTVDNRDSMAERLTLTLSVYR